jgi:hypothetical protein
VVLSVGLNATWSAITEEGIARRRNVRMMNFSTIRDKIGVSEIGVKSPSCRGMETFGIELTKVARQWSGAVSLVIKQLNK